MNLRILPSLDALHVFASAARLGSFKAAAVEHSLTPTAVSHRIRNLEAHLGQALFVRKVRAVELTASGVELAQAVQSGLQGIADAVARIRSHDRQVVVLSLIPEFAAKWLVPHMAAFHEALPDVEVHIHASYAVADLAGGAADLAVRYGAREYVGLDCTPLMQECFAPLASPALCARLPAAPHNWPLLHLDWFRPEQAVAWQDWARAAGVSPQDMQGGFHSSDAGHVIQAAVAGQGVALLGLQMTAAERTAGLLQVVCEPLLPDRFYTLCVPLRHRETPAVMAVRDWLVRHVRDVMAE